MGAAGEAQEGWRCSLELGGGCCSVGELWQCLEQAGEDTGALQTCSEAAWAIDTMSARSEGRGVLLEVVRSSGDVQEQVLLTGAAVWLRTSPKKEGQRRG